MTQEEFLDRLEKIRPWLIKASLLVAIYFAYRVISPESIWGWLFIPFLGLVFYILLELINQKLENIF